jgi:hypothetical protein
MAGASRAWIHVASGVGTGSWLAGSWLAGSLFACSGMLTEPAPQVETAALHDSAGDAVIATLHTKDSELKVTSSGGSVRYSLLDDQGISKSLTLEELRSYDPNLYEFVKAAMASSSPRSGGGPVFDARIDARRGLTPVSTERVEADRHRAAPAGR